MNTDKSQKIIYNDISIVPDSYGNIICGGGTYNSYIQVKQQFIIYSNERMIRSEKRAFEYGMKHDLVKLEWTNETKLNKDKYQIITEEWILMVSEEELECDLIGVEYVKRAWENGPILKSQGYPILSRNYLTSDMSLKSNYVEHDNWDEIQEYIFINKSGKVFTELNEYEDGINGEICFYQETIRFDSLLKQYVRAYKSLKFIDTIKKLEQINLGDYFHIIEVENVLSDGVESMLFGSNFNLHFYVCPKRDPYWSHLLGVAYTLGGKLVYKKSFLSTDRHQRDVVVHQKELDLSVDSIIGLDGSIFSFQSIKAYLCIRKTKNKNGDYYLFFSPVYYKRFFNTWFDHNYMYGFRTTDEVSKKINVGDCYDIAQELFDKVDEINVPIIHHSRNGGYKIGIVMDYFLKSDEKIKRITDELSFRKLFTQQSMLKLINEAEIDQYYQEEHEQMKKDTQTPNIFIKK